MFGKILCGCGSRAERHELWPVNLYTCSVSWPCLHGNWLLDCRTIPDRGPRAGVDLGIALVFCLFIFVFVVSVSLFLSVCAHMFLFGDQRLMFSRTLYLIFLDSLFVILKLKFQIRLVAQKPLVTPVQGSQAYTIMLYNVVHMLYPGSGDQPLVPLLVQVTEPSP